MKRIYQELLAYCGFHNLPEGIEEFYEKYAEPSEKPFIRREFLHSLYERFELAKDQQEYLEKACEAIEKDETLLHFSKFLVWDMCNARNRCSKDDYQLLEPACMRECQEAYGFLILLACVEPAMKLMEERGVPKEYYQDIPYRPMVGQFKKWKETGDIRVSDFPWDLNFYTCAIFLFDRFLFIPYRFGDNFTMYRHKESKKVIALWHGGDEFRRDGQFNGVNKIFDPMKYDSIWEETQEEIKANPVSPMGFVKAEPVILKKSEWEVALQQGDLLLGLHVPSGPGYTPERLKNSMELAHNFYKEYYKELDIKGFWSESWLYDSRLSLVLEEEKSNIIKVQRQYYLYPVMDGDGMIRLEVFGGWKVDPLTVTPKSSLQKAAKEYMEQGKRFNNLSMIVLNEEIEQIGSNPYITKQDIDEFYQIVDTHLN